MGGSGYSGTTWWLEEDYYEAGILAAIVSRDKISFDVDSNDSRYTVVLEPAPAGGEWWRGKWRNRAQESGPVQVRRYDSAGGLALIGRWHEDGDDYQWIVELRLAAG